MVVRVDLQSVTSIWTLSQHDGSQQPAASALAHPAAQSDDQSTRATSTVQQPSTDSRQTTRTKRRTKNIRQLLSNRVAPLTQSSSGPDGSASMMVVDRRRLELPVYSRFLAGCSQVHAADDAGVVVASRSVDLDNNRHDVHLQKDPAAAAAAAGKEDDDDDDDAGTVAAQSECCSDRLSSAADVDEAESEEVDSNYSIASSDTAALSIKLDQNYDPIVETPTEPQPPPLARASTAAKAVVRPLEARQSNIPVLRASASLPRTAVTSKSNSATQTSAVHPPLAYYHQPFPYPVFGYGPTYVPPVPALCETPIWPPFAYPPPPPLSWYYGSGPMQFMPAAPPYCVVPPSATTASNSNQSSLPQQTEPTTRPVVDPHPAATVAPSQPTVVPPPTAAATTDDKLFRPIAGRSCFQPTAGSLFRPVASGEDSGRRRQISHSEPTRVDEKLSRSLLEMVELITPQLDSGTDPASANSEADDDAEDEAEREAWEADERERQRMRRRHTRQWMRALRTDIDHTQLSDTSL